MVVTYRTFEIATGEHVGECFYKIYGYERPATTAAPADKFSKFRLFRSRIGYASEQQAL